MASKHLFSPLICLACPKGHSHLFRGTLHESNYKSSSSSSSSGGGKATINNKPTKLEILHEHLRWCLFIILVQHSYSDCIWLIWEGLQSAAVAELHWQLQWHFSNHILTVLLEPYFYRLFCYFCTGYLNQPCIHFDWNEVWN